MDRRKFLGYAAVGSAVPACSSLKAARPTAEFPIVIATWEPNLPSVGIAAKMIAEGSYALDAIEKGINRTELDPEDHSVGYGGYPDRDGVVTLDACVMNEHFGIGSVMALEEIATPISVARKVMEKTPHVQIVGKGAQRFALEQGFKRQNLLTPQAEQAWREWLKTSKYDPQNTLRELQNADSSNHDTIGMLAIDKANRLCGGCSTSGMAFKMQGRVGDSPIIGSGLYVDNEVGAASGSGVGEDMIRINAAFAIVEYMRQGRSPAEACRLAVERLVHIKDKDSIKSTQACFIAVNKSGQYGCYSLFPKFSIAVSDAKGMRTEKSPSYFQ